MSSNGVVRVTLTIELANGDLHTVVRRDPSPAGGNPRFMGQQLASAAEELTRRLDDTLATYAEQIR